MSIGIARLRLVTAIVLAALAASGASSSLASPSPSQPAPDRGDVRNAEERLHELERDFELVVEHYNAIAERYLSFQTGMATTELEIRRLERGVAKARGEAVSVATDMYKNGSVEELEAMLSSSSLADIQQRIEYTRTSQSITTSTFTALEENRRELEGKLADLDDARLAAARSKERLGELAETIESKLAGQRQEIDELNEALALARQRRARRERIEDRRAAVAALEAAETPDGPPADSLGPLGAGLMAGAPAAGNGAVVAAALSQLGKPYEWAADGPETFDCSGLTMWAWAHAGVSLPHNSGMQYAATPRVSQGEWEPGDLLFYGSPIHHVSMYIGKGKMVEAPYTGSIVRIESPYRSDYVGAGRPG